MKSPATKRIGYPPTSWQRLVIVVLLTVAALAVGHLTAQANDYTSDDQWNIMVIPGNQTVFSGKAKEMFNNSCARCHSEDGRAQTAVARQRHVQDLSECTLPDDEIIRQILEGTHTKTNSFKMPPFKGKFTHEEVESLVPLVKAFRPMPTPEASIVATPRLVGIINVEHAPFAIFQAANSNARHFILREKESHEGVALLKLKPKTCTVKISVNGTSPEKSLTLAGDGNTPHSKGISGFFSRLGLALSDAPRKVVLSNANLDVVLFLYSQFTGRTLICSPQLPDAVFDLDFPAPSPEMAAHRLKQALAAKGITTYEGGEKFILVVPSAEAARLREQSHGITLPPLENNRPDPFPGGAFINLPGVELSNAVTFYTVVTRRTLNPGQTIPSDHTVKFTTQTALSPQECANAFEVLFRLHGLEVVPATQNTFKLNPITP